MRREEIDALAERLNALLARLERDAPPEVVEAVAELLEGIQRVHAEGLRRVAELLGEDRARFARALDDPVISNLFLLYDLAVVDERGRAEAALASVRPLAREHGGEIQLVDVEDGVVSVRLHGACHGCPSSTATLRGGLERVLGDRLPGFVRVEVVDANGGPGESRGRAPDAGLPTTGPDVLGPPASGPGARAASPTGDVSIVPERKLVRLERRLARGRERRETGGNGRGRGEGDPGAGAARGGRAGGAAGPAGGDPGPTGGHAEPGLRRLEAAALAELPDRQLHGSLVDDIALLLIALDGEIAAYRNACPGSILPLHLGRLEEGTIVCPWHGCRFDARTGEREGDGGPPLEPLAVSVEDDRVYVEVR